MLETIDSALNTAMVYFSIGLFSILGLLFVLSCLCIAVWLYNWQVFVLAGTAWGGLALAVGYAWLCVTYYKPFIEWMPKQNSSRLQVEQVNVLPRPAALAPTSLGPQPEGLAVVDKGATPPARAEPVLETKDDRLDALVDQIQRRELQTAQ